MHHAPGTGYSHSRLEAAPTIPPLVTWERLPAANVELCGQTSHRFDAGYEFMRQQ